MRIALPDPSGAPTTDAWFSSEAGSGMRARLGAQAVSKRDRINGRKVRQEGSKSVLPSKILACSPPLEEAFVTPWICAPFAHCQASLRAEPTPKFGFGQGVQMAVDSDQSRVSQLQLRHLPYVPTGGDATFLRGEGEEGKRCPEARTRRYPPRPYPRSSRRSHAEYRYEIRIRPLKGRCPNTGHRR